MYPIECENPGQNMQLATSTTTRLPSEPTSSTRVETASEWFQRSQRNQAAKSSAPPKDPTAAAWDFCRPRSRRRGTSSSGSHIPSNGTGIAFVDACLCRCNSHRNLPVLDIRGASCTGKTWTVVSLASRFVIATQPALFAFASCQQNRNTQGRDIDFTIQQETLPQVLILDSQYNVTIPKLAYTIRSMLLRSLTSSDVSKPESKNDLMENADKIKENIEDCLCRIQIANSADLMGWVPVLETIRYRLARTAKDFPTLMLWDGFLTEPNSKEASRMEIIRQLERILLECSVLLITTTTQDSMFRNNRREWERFITHRIRLGRNDDDKRKNSSNHEYMATVYGAQIPYTIFMAGILS